MSAYLTRAQLLLQTHRPAEAEREAREGLGVEPQNPYLLRLLCLALLEQEKVKAARAAAQDLTGLAPDWAESHLTVAKVEITDENFPEARRAAQTARQLAPNDATAYALLSGTYFGEKRWQAALTEAEAGLKLDPENDYCNNFRALTLNRLGRKAEGLLTAEASLRRNPENSDAHFTAGWVKLQDNAPADALDHFVEALRLDPANEAARNGLVEALKARNPIYRCLLAYSSWLMQLTPGERRAIIWGGIIGYNIFFRSVDNPSLATILIVLWLTLVMLTWAGSSFFDFLLLFDPRARHALDVRQRAAGIAVAACLASTAAWIGAGFIDPRLDPVVAYGILLFALPFSRIFNRRRGWRKITGYIVFALITALLFAAMIDSFTSRDSVYAIGLLLLLVAYSWLGPVLDE